MVCKYFFPVCSLSFHPLWVFPKAKFLILMKFNLVNGLLSVGWALVVKHKNYLPSSTSQKYLSYDFFHKSFIVVHFTFNSVIHFKLIFVLAASLIKAHFCASGYLMVPVPFVERLFFEFFMYPLKNSFGYNCVHPLLFKKIKTTLIISGRLTIFWMG